jgi:hypothetical protein
MKTLDNVVICGYLEDMEITSTERITFTSQSGESPSVIYLICSAKNEIGELTHWERIARITGTAKSGFSVEVRGFILPNRVKTKLEALERAERFVRNNALWFDLKIVS